MLFLDVTVLAYANREDSPHHSGFLPWLESLVSSEQAYGLTDLEYK